MVTFLQSKYCSKVYSLAPLLQGEKKNNTKQNKTNKQTKKNRPLQSYLKTVETVCGPPYILISKSIFLIKKKFVLVYSVKRSWYNGLLISTKQRPSNGLSKHLCVNGVVLIHKFIRKQRFCTITELTLLRQQVVVATHTVVIFHATFNACWVFLDLHCRRAQ